MLTKLKGTYIDALPLAGQPARPGASTRRSTRPWPPPGGSRPGSEPPEHPHPHRARHGASARRSSPSPGNQIVIAADYSQIELRILAHLSGDPVLLAAFRDGAGHPHAHRARDVRRRARAGDVRAAPRRQGDQLRPRLRPVASSVSRKRCASRARGREDYITSYFQRYAGVRAYMDARSPRRATRGGATTLLGPPPHAA